MAAEWRRLPWGKRGRGGGWWRWRLLCRQRLGDERRWWCCCGGRRRGSGVDEGVTVGCGYDAVAVREGVAAAAGETSGGGWGDAGGDGKGVVVGGEGDKVAVTVVVAFGGG
nr:hypothetical protein [Tanacetum cinerariifolium]